MFKLEAQDVSSQTQILSVTLEAVTVESGDTGEAFVKGTRAAHLKSIEIPTTDHFRSCFPRDFHSVNVIPDQAQQRLQDLLCICPRSRAVEQE